MDNQNYQINTTDQPEVSPSLQPEVTPSLPTLPQKATGETQEPLPPTINIKDHIVAAIARNLKPIENLEITEAEEKILSEPIPDEAIQILPHGQIYLPWSFYADRMNRAFGRTKWSLIPIGDIRIRTSPTTTGALTITREYALIIKGCFVGTAFGEQDFFPRNQQMTEVEAIEATQSNAIRRLVGKRLGVGLALWDKEFVEAWLNKYAIQDALNRKTGKMEWRKKTPEEITNDQKPQVPKNKKVKNEPTKSTTHMTKEEKITMIVRLAGKQGKNIPALRDEMKKMFGVDSTNDLTAEQVDQWLANYLSPSPQTPETPNKGEQQNDSQ